MAGPAGAVLERERARRDDYERAGRQPYRGSAYEARHLARGDEYDDDDAGDM